MPTQTEIKKAIAVLQSLTAPKKEVRPKLTFDQKVEKCMKHILNKSK